MAAPVAGEEGDRATSRRFHRLSLWLVALRASEREARCHRALVSAPASIMLWLTCRPTMAPRRTTGSHTRDTRRSGHVPAWSSSGPVAYGISGRQGRSGEAPACSGSVAVLPVGLHNSNALGGVDGHAQQLLTPIASPRCQSASRRRRWRRTR